jgi:hypothetical protein
LRLGLPILVAILIGCGPAAPREIPAPIQVQEGPPVVLFRLLIIRDWQTPYYLIATEDHDFTLQEAIAFGIPAELWIKFAMENPRDYRQEAFWVRPLRA